MALDLKDLEKYHHFKFETTELGEVICHKYISSVISELNIENVRNSNEFAKHLIVLTCSKVDDLDTKVSAAQVDLLKASEVEDFSEKFVNKYSYYLVKSENKETLRHNGETNADYLFRVMVIYGEQYLERAKVIEKLFSASTQGLLDKNQILSDKLRAKSIHGIDIHRTPNVGKSTVEAQLLASFNDVVLGMTIDEEKNRKENRSWNSVMLLVGMLSIAISSYVSVNSSSQTEELLKEQNSLLRKQMESQKRVIDSISLLPSLLEKEVIQGKDEKIILNEISRQLKSMSDQSSLQPLMLRVPYSKASD